MLLVLLKCWPLKHRSILVCYARTILISFLRKARKRAENNRYPVTNLEKQRKELEELHSFSKTGRKVDTETKENIAQNTKIQKVKKTVMHCIVLNLRKIHVCIIFKVFIKPLNSHKELIFLTRLAPRKCRALHSIS